MRNSFCKIYCISCRTLKEPRLQTNLLKSLNQSPDCISLHASLRQPEVGSPLLSCLLKHWLLFIAFIPPHALHPLLSISSFFFLLYPPLSFFLFCHHVVPCRMQNLAYCPRESKVREKDADVYLACCKWWWLYIHWSPSFSCRPWLTRILHLQYIYKYKQQNKQYHRQK